MKAVLVLLAVVIFGANTVFAQNPEAKSKIDLIKGEEALIAHLNEQIVRQSKAKGDVALELPSELLHGAGFLAGSFVTGTASFAGGFAVGAARSTGRVIFRNASVIAFILAAAGTVTYVVKTGETFYSLNVEGNKLESLHAMLEEREAELKVLKASLE